MTLAGAMGCSLDAPARDLTTAVRKQNEAAIRKRLFEARKAGEPSKEVNVDDYTRYLSLLPAGLSIQAANGSKKAELNGLRKWPCGIWDIETCRQPAADRARSIKPSGIQSSRHTSRVRSNEGAYKVLGAKPCKQAQLSFDRITR
jgi:hypothetical protein